MYPVSNFKKYILTLPVDITTYENVCKNVIMRANKTIGAYICVANVHMCMESFDNSDFRKIINKADIVVPDGRPLVWALKLLGHKSAIQIRGTNLMLKICEEAEKKNIAVGFYGGTEESLKKLVRFKRKKFPALVIGFHSTPPFRQLTFTEGKNDISNINASGVQILFVGLGCPKQEKWMAEHKNKLSCVMIGVGAAFDFLSGTKKHAPGWMQKIGLEWAFRLACEPGRLWQRYFKHNSRFIVLFMRQLLREGGKK